MQRAERRDLTFYHEGLGTTLSISRNYSPHDIESLLQNIFGVNRKVVGVKEIDTGIFYVSPKDILKHKRTISLCYCLPHSYFKSNL